MRGGLQRSHRLACYSWFSGGHFTAGDGKGGEERKERGGEAAFCHFFFYNLTNGRHYSPIYIIVNELKTFQPECINTAVLLDQYQTTCIMLGDRLCNMLTQGFYTKKCSSQTLYHLATPWCHPLSLTTAIKSNAHHHGSRNDQLILPSVWVSKLVVIWRYLGKDLLHHVYEVSCTASMLGKDGCTTSNDGKQYRHDKSVCTHRVTLSHSSATVINWRYQHHYLSWRILPDHYCVLALVNVEFNNLPLPRPLRNLAGIKVNWIWLSWERMFPGMNVPGNFRS